MKRLALAAVAAAALVLSGCSKEGASRFEGNYSYSLGGMLTFSPAGGTSGSIGAGGSSDGSPAVAADDLTAVIKSESGQMDLVTVSGKSGEMLVTLRPLAGGVLVFDAVADGKTLTLKPVSHRISVDFGDGILTGNADMDVEISGTGERYSDMIRFAFTYSGSCTHAGQEYEISASDVTCVAVMND